MKNVAFLGVFFAVLTWGCKDPEPEPQPEPRPSAPAWSLDALTVYEVFPRQFSGSGHLNALRTRIPELKALGVNCVWLMPVHPISEVNMNGTYGSPYAVADFMDVHPDLGDLEVMRALVDELHEAGMLCLIDWVANHTGWDHPWIAAHPDWYTQDAAGNIVIPPGTNWSDVADLNYNSGEMRAAMVAAMRFWSEDIGVDGFRCDYAVGVPNDFWATTIVDLNAERPDAPLLWLAEADAASLHDVGFEVSYSWQGYGAVEDVVANGALPNAIYTAYANEQAELPAGHRKLRFVTNHDETSWNAAAPSLFGGVEAMQCAQAITAFLPGLPLVYNGQEVGSSQMLNLFEDVPIDWSTHPELRSWYTTLLTTVRDHPALKGTDLVYHPDEDVFVAVRLGADGEARALLVANVRNFAVSFDYAPWLGPDWEEVFSGAGMPVSGTLGAFGVRLFVQ